MANEEMARYLGVFLDEANEQLEILEQAILRLEHNADPDTLQAIFRAAHTLKGSSRAMGFMSMGDLTHALEDVFDLLRRNALTVNTVIVDTLFEGLDLLKRLVAEVAESGETTIPTHELTARLRAVTQEHAAPVASDPSSDSGPGPAHPSATEDFPSLSASAQEAAQEALRQGCALHALTIRIADDCVMKSVRALMALQSLETLGTILDTTPDEEAIENEEFGVEFGVLLATHKTPEEVRSLLLGIAEIVDVTVRPYALRSNTANANPLSAAEACAAASPPPPIPAEQEPVTPDSAAVVGEAPTKKRSEVSSPKQTIRVDVARLDMLLNLVGELVIDQTRIAQIAGQMEGRHSGDPLVESLCEASAHFGRITAEMQAEIMKARMLPIENVFNRFPRMMRDLAQKLHKEMDFIISGRDTELDRSVIEVIGDPLIHLLRNSVDHGLEPPDEREASGKPRKGTIWLRARHEENYIVVEVEDDGRGMDPEKIRATAVQRGLCTQEAAARLNDKEALHLIFASGFSTAQQVSDISGRGVGMDIVKNNLTRFGALIDVDSKAGKGTRFTIKLPLTLAIIQGLLVKVGTGLYVIPLTTVMESIRIASSQIHTINHREVILQRGMTLPLVWLQRLFHQQTGSPFLRHEDTAEEETFFYVVIVGVGERRFGLVVDSLLGEQEIVIKSLGKFIGDIRGVSGATILGDGRIALIVDVNGLLAIATEERVEAHAA